MNLMLSVNNANHFEAHRVEAVDIYEYLVSPVIFSPSLTELEKKDFQAKMKTHY